MDKVPNASMRELCGVIKELMEEFSSGSAMWRDWRMIGLLRGCIRGVYINQYVSHGRGGLMLQRTA